MMSNPMFSINVSFCEVDGKMCLFGAGKNQFLVYY